MQRLATTLDALMAMIAGGLIAHAITLVIYAT